MSLLYGNPVTASGGVGSSLSGTSGSVVFVDSSGNLADDNAHLFWDITHKRLGIGTASPSAPLQVEHDAIGTAQDSTAYGILIRNSTSSSQQMSPMLALEATINLGAARDIVWALQTQERINSNLIGGGDVSQLSFLCDYNAGGFNRAFEFINSNEGHTGGTLAIPQIGGTNKPCIVFYDGTSTTTAYTAMYGSTSGGFTLETGGNSGGVAASWDSSGYLTNHNAIEVKLSSSFATGSATGVYLNHAYNATSTNTAQNSPFIQWRGYGWNTSTTTSQAADFKAQVEPTEGNPPTAKLVFYSAVNAGTYNEVGHFTGGGDLSVKGNVVVLGSDAPNIYGSASTTGIQVTSLAVAVIRAGSAIANFGGGGYTSLTEFVRLTRGVADRTVTRLSSNTTIASQPSQNVYVCTGTFTVTLPALSGSNDGIPLVVKNAGTGTVTVTFSGSNTIDGAASSVTISAGSTTTFVGDNTNSDWITF